MLSKESFVQECDATGNDKWYTAGLKKNFLIILFFYNACHQPE